MVTRTATLDLRVEMLCEHGCRAVRDYIEALSMGQDLPQFEGLNAAQRVLLRQELEAVMVVYGDGCRL